MLVRIHRHDPALLPAISQTAVRMVTNCQTDFAVLFLKTVKLHVVRKEETFVGWKRNETNRWSQPQAKIQQILQKEDIFSSLDAVWQWQKEAEMSKKNLGPNGPKRDL